MLKISRVGGQERSGQWGLKQCKRWDDVKETEGKVKDDNLRKVKWEEGMVKKMANGLKVINWKCKMGR